jgi:hypothetical protein
MQDRVKPTGISVAVTGVPCQFGQQHPRKGHEYRREAVEVQHVNGEDEHGYGKREKNRTRSLLVGRCSVDEGILEKDIMYE